MKIAVACDGLEVAPQASRCSSFTCYTVTNGIISGCSNVPNMGITLKECVSTLNQMNINVLIAGMLNADLGRELETAGIEYVLSSASTPSEAAQSYLHRTLLGEETLAEAYRDDGPLDELDDLFARIERKLVVNHG